MFEYINFREYVEGTYLINGRLCQYFCKLLDYLLWTMPPICKQETNQWKSELHSTTRLIPPLNN